MVKKYFFLFLLLAGIHQQSNAFSITEKVSDFVEASRIGWASFSSLIGSDYQFSILGSENVSPPLDNAIHAILAELGLQHKIVHIKQMSDRLKKDIGWGNALATANAIYVDEGYMLSLEPERLRALIGHEGIHIKDRHALKSLVFLIAWLIVSEKVEKYMIPNWDSGILATLVKMFGFGVVSSTAFMLVMAKLHRSQERAADEQSVALLDCRKGALALHKQAAPIQICYQSEKTSFFNKLTNWVIDKFSTHPSCEERIAYLSQDT